jgi:LPS export ABC transporter permease LptG/LPS export ABC transporter permease LptF
VRIFTRYILREVTGYALLGGVLFTFILFMRYLLPLMELAVLGIASTADLARLIAYLLPNFFTLTIPMAVLVGILLGLSRLSADSEITAMRASGMGVPAFIRIISLFAAVCWALCTVNTLWVAPGAARRVLQYDEHIKSSGAAARKVEPRVFYEGYKNDVLYVQDVDPGANGTALWKHVFLADLTHPESPHIITAEQAIVLNTRPQTLDLIMANGTRHDIATDDPGKYDISTFSSSELPVETGQPEEDSHLSRRDTPIHAMPTSAVWGLAQRNNKDARAYRIELQRRLAFPAACFVLMLVGVPLGLSSKRGGKGAGFVVTLALVFLYYFLSSIGMAMATQGKLSPFLGVWGANILFFLAGAVLVQQLSRGSLALDLLAGLGKGLTDFFARVSRKRTQQCAQPNTSGDAVQRIRRALRIRFPLVLDEYVMGSFARNFILVLLSLTALFLIFTFFELIGDIIKNRTPLVTVGDYLVNLVPFVLYNVTPVCSLVAVLMTFGGLSRTSELTAMKATGVSLYRVVAPVLLAAAIVSAALFAFDEGYLPAANRRQEALLNAIKGKPAQTFERPDRKWISGQASRSGEPSRIFYYQFFDPDRNIFANLTVFEFKPGTFALQRRLFASSAHWDPTQNDWVLEHGWQRTFDGDAISGYQTFDSAAQPEIHEAPAYFKKEDRQSQEMSYTELSGYIRDLRQAGFDTTRLRIQLNRKLAYPLIALVMAVLAVPFSLSAGKRGNIAGMGAAIGLAIAYWVVAGVFENLGNVNTLPAVLAAWSPDLLFGMAGAYLLLRTPT